MVSVSLCSSVMIIKDINCTAPANTNGNGFYEESETEWFTCDSGYSLPNGNTSIGSTCTSGEWTPPADCGYGRSCLKFGCDLF